MEFNPPLNLLPNHRQIQRFRSQNTPNQPIYSTHYDPLRSSQFNPPRPLINHHYHDHPYLLHHQTYGHCGLSDFERKLRDEVIYLHSLWHRGPPVSIPQQNPHLKPSSSTLFKKKKKKKCKKTLQSRLVSDKEWPVDPKPTCPSPPGSGWAQFKPRLAPNFRPATAEEQARISALKVQLKGLDSCIGLFRKSVSESSDEEEEEDDEEDDYADDCDEEFEFLLKVFEGDDQLRGYYEKNCEDGEFYCLVCGVIGNKLGRKYKNCVALVQHSVSISKTKKKKAHRAYGYVVCKVLGWDINRLPSLPASNGDGITKSLEKSCELQVEAKKHVDGCEDKLNAVDVEAVFAKASDSQLEQKDVPNEVDKDNVSCTDDGCYPNNLVDSESGRNGKADGSKEETHNSLMSDGVCTSFEHGQSEQENPLVGNPIDCEKDDVNKNLAVDKRVTESGTNVEVH